jgi:hypothetical protein
MGQHHSELVFVSREQVGQWRPLLRRNEKRVVLTEPISFQIVGKQETENRLLQDCSSGLCPFFEDGLLATICKLRCLHLNILIAKM